MYAKVTNYDEDPNYESRTETVVGRDYRYTRTIYVPVGTPSPCAIPPRRQPTTLDLSKVAEASAWANQIAEDLNK